MLVGCMSAPLPVGLFVVVLCHRATASTLRRRAEAPVGDVYVINAPMHLRNHHCVQEKTRLGRGEMSWEERETVSIAAAPISTKQGGRAWKEERRKRLWR